LAKEKAKQERIDEQERKKQDEILRQQQAEADLEAEKLAKQQEKLEREQQKKQLRKARQQLRRMSSNSFQEEGVYSDAYDLEQDVEYLCSTLSLNELMIVNEAVDGKEGAACMQVIKSHVEQAKLRAEDGQVADFEACEDNAASSTSSSYPTNKNGCKKDSNPWTSQELSALVKGVKKHPGAGANRWDTICSYINSLCQQDTPRTKEECIEKFNQVARQGAKDESCSANGLVNGNGVASAAATSTTPFKAAAPSPEDWSAEQDQQLQDGLGKYPAAMDKNERWAAIAKGVSGKTKKDCVQRFKEIRDAIKNKNEG
jgi:DnaJ family protein C protein 2